MNAHYVADRSLLLALWQQHPEWTNPTLAQATGRSLAWVKKWKARFRAHPDDPDVIWGRTSASSTAAPFAPRVIEQILAIRDTPPEQLQRTPGPRAILYFLPRSPEVHGERLPRSTRTIWKILRAHDRIPQHRRRPHGAQERPEPLVELQLDFKDVVQVDPLASTKQAHAVEVFDAVDVGTSLWLMGEPSATYTAATVFAPLLHLLQQIGLPERVRFDRDPRFLGSTPACATFRPPSCGSGTPWACSRWSIRPGDRTSTPSSNGCTPPWSANIGRSPSPTRWRRRGRAYRASSSTIIPSVPTRA
jgi:hypothetical protein